MSASSSLKARKCILLVNRFYGGEQTPTGRMLQDVAELLADLGHDVRVLTSRLEYAGTAAGNSASTGSITVRAVRSGWGSSRLVHWFGFWLRAALSVAFGRWDRCLILTDPPFMLFAAAFSRVVRRGERHVYWWTMDLYPEALIANGMMGARSLAARMLCKVNDLGLRHARGVVALGWTQRRRLCAYSAFDPSATYCEVVPPWDLRPLRPKPREGNRFLGKYGWSARKLALYAGNLGEAHIFEPLLAVARLLQARGDREWVFAFVARGSRREALEHASVELDNVVVMDYQPPEMTGDLLSGATVHLITLKPGWEGICVPSKLYSVASTGLPVLFVGPRDADTAIEIENYGLGACVAPDEGAERVLAELDRLGHAPSRRRIPMLTDGPWRIAKFITR